MKINLRNEHIGKRNLISSIATGRLRADQTEPFIYNTYLEAWWECLKLSGEYQQSCRTGFFITEEAYQNYCLFGEIEDLTFQEWWLRKGHRSFGESITTLQIKLFVKRELKDSFQVTLSAYQEVSSQLIAQELAFWLDQINLLNIGGGFLSSSPLCWPIFQSRITYEVIMQLLRIKQIYDNIKCGNQSIKLWQIGEQLKLKPNAMPKIGDYPMDIADKHKAMGQTVSNYLKKGNALVENAYKGYFPKFII